MALEVRRASVDPFAGAGRRRIRISEGGLVTPSFLDPARACPLVVQPAMPDVSVNGWAQKNLEWIESSLLTHGAILFRGFDIGDQPDLEAFCDAIGLERMHYMEGATPRKKLGDHVYTSTEFPPEHSIALHNELSYVLTWPMKIIFFGVVAPLQGGATPIADMRKVYARIPPDVLAPFAEKGWMLVRNFGDGLSLTWQNAYRTADKADLEAYASSARLSLEWKDDAHLRTRQVRPAVTRHPKTNDLVWFNHIVFWHVSSLDPRTRDVLVNEFGEDGIPYNTYYGDGSPIADAVIAQLRQAYDAETIAFPWQKGDLLLLDNMLIAHGRQPFSGARRILVSMGQPFTRTDL